MGGVHDHRNAGETRGESSYKSRLRCVGVDDLIGLLAQEAAQAEQTAEVPNWPDLPADHIHVYQAQAMLFDRLLKDRVRRQNIDLPALGLGDLPQTENDSCSPAVARFSDYMQEPHRLCSVPGQHVRGPRPHGDIVHKLVSQSPTQDCVPSRTAAGFDRDHSRQLMTVTPRTRCTTAATAMAAAPPTSPADGIQHAHAKAFDPATSAYNGT